MRLAAAEAYHVRDRAREPVRIIHCLPATMLYQNRRIQNYYGHFWQRLYSGHEFRNCLFVSCSLSNTRRPERRSILRNVKFIDCELVGCALGTAIVEDVVVYGLKINGLFQTWAAVFQHVTIRGKVDRIMLSSAVAAGLASAGEQRAFEEANAAFYDAVDWALDIREAEFVEADLRGVPGRLIRRDPETQVLITRERASEGIWRELDLSKTYWPAAIKFFLDSKMESEVLVAPKRALNFAALLDGLMLLREAGVAEKE